MADYDSDSSGAEDIETGVTLGYATKDATGDDFSQLGGYPSWLDETAVPSGSLSKCKVCNGYLTLLLQLNSDLPDKFPGHERRVYIFGCKQKACRRKEGSIRGIRTTRISAISQDKTPAERTPPPAEAPKPKQTNIGESLFGVQPSKTNQNANPFAAPGSAAAANPFSTTNKAPSSNPFASSPSQPSAETKQIDSLTTTFASKARIGLPSPSTPPATIAGPKELWPARSALPNPYPTYSIDADKEYLDPTPASIPQNVRLAESGEFETSTSTSGNNADDKAALDSAMDTTFQKFADRLAQNPEQVLRYDFGGQPLLYSKKDAVGSAGEGKWPRCERCGAERVFELQLTPHAITELESEDLSLEGMDWGTILLASCEKDCSGDGEEWVGVQWEELTGR